MKEVYNRLFSKVTPRMSGDELSRLVLDSRRGANIMKENKQENNKKRGMKFIVVPIAAAIAIAGTTVGAVAVYQRNITEEYNNTLEGHASVFPQEYKDKDGNKADFGEKALETGVYEKLNIALDKTFEYDDFTLEFPGAIGSGDEIRVMFNIIFKEKPDLGEDDPEYYPHLFFEGKKDETKDENLDKNWYGNCTGVYGDRGGKLTYSSYLTLQDIGDDDEMIKLNLTWLTRSNVWHEDEGWDIDVELEIPITDEIRAFNKTVVVSSAPHVELGDWGDWDLVGLKVTPFNVEFNLSTEGETPDPRVCKYYSPKIPVYITFTDGSVLDIARYGGSSNGIDEENKTLHITKSLNYPIDIDSIQSIQFASAVVNLDGTATTVDIEKIPIEGVTLEEKLDPNNPNNWCK